MSTTPESELEQHLYLEEVLGESALEKVKAWNARSLSRLEANPLFDQLYAEALEIVNSKDKIPYVSFRDGQVHNFWQDADHVRGVWRTTTLQSYLTDSPEWEVVLDVDALAEAESKNWVYRGNILCPPDNALSMVCLSDGGKDAVVYREFDIQSRTFVEAGFITHESKGSVSWLDEDHLLLGLDFGADNNGVSTLTDSGYPMTTRLWQRGTALDDAAEIGRGIQSDVSFRSAIVHSDFVGQDAQTKHEVLLVRSVNFYDHHYFWLPRDATRFKDKVELPLTSKLSVYGVFKDQMIVNIYQDWRAFKSGDLLSFSWSDFMALGDITEVHLLHSPGERESVSNIGITASRVLVSLLNNVVGSALAFGWDGKAWTSVALKLPSFGSVSIGSTHRAEDIAYISTDSFLAPSTLWQIDTSSHLLQPEVVKSLPDWFDSGSMTAEQLEVSSKDGTTVPYFVIHKNNMPLNSKNPALLYGYGGFQVSLNPTYSATRGKLWVERGGVYVHANIRGGGEFGPAWHQAGLKTKRQCIYDDFIAVAEDLIDRKITAPRHLGIEGGSNGGLLVGVMLTQRPDLFAAVICAVPLLDMLRYHLLPAGASWVGEYGDPGDPEERRFLQSISPYHNVQADERYPEIFLLTSTKDDRVHPAHARKMAARLEDLGHEFLYYENIDGGHSASANLQETARRVALQHTYLFEKLS